MTASEIVQQIEAAGGVLILAGDRIRYELPEQAAPLVDVLRQYRDEVVQTLRGRQDAVKQHISRWMAASCTVPLNPGKVWTSEKCLYRDYGAWCQSAKQTPCSRSLFCAILNECFERELDGWQGLCLALDFAAAKGTGTGNGYRM